MTAELEEQLAMRSREIDEIKQARARDSQDSLANAKDRLAMLHSEVCRATPCLSYPG